jgi:hypothetical protein
MIILHLAVLASWAYKHALFQSSCPAAHELRGPMLIYVCCVLYVFLMFKHWLCWKYQYNIYKFNFIYIYSFIPMSGCVGRLNTHLSYIPSMLMLKMHRPHWMQCDDNTLHDPLGLVIVQYNIYKFNFIYIYSFIPMSGCVGMGPKCTVFAGVPWCC